MKNLRDWLNLPSGKIQIIVIQIHHPDKFTFIIQQREINLIYMEVQETENQILTLKIIFILTCQYKWFCPI